MRTTFEPQVFTDLAIVDADRLRRLLDRQAVRHRPSPARDGVTPSRRFDIWGLRVEKPRRRPTVPDNLPRQAKNLHGGLLRLVDSQLSASETSFPFSAAPSHICLNPDRRRLTRRWWSPTSRRSVSPSASSVHATWRFFGLVSGRSGAIPASLRAATPHAASPTQPCNSLDRTGCPRRSPPSCER